MRYTKLLANRVRRHTGNTDIPNDDSGIEDESIIDYLNDGIALIQSIIYPEMPEFFNTTEEITIVGQQVGYTLNGATFLGDTIASVEYSEDGSARRYRSLRRIVPLERNNEHVSTPGHYFVQGGKIFLSGVPNTSKGTLRVTYTRVLNKIDIRRGRVASTVNDGTDYTTITLETTNPVPHDDQLNDRDKNEPFTVVDTDGVIQHANIPYTNFNTSTEIITLGSGVALTSGTISAGDYIVFGEYATTHSELPPTFEPYLVQYAVRQILANEESSIDVAANDPVLRAWTDAITNSVQNISSVYQFPAQVDPYYA